MGKPFKSELNNLSETIIWADSQDITPLHAFLEKDNNVPLLSVGSGGSFSACYYSSLLYENKYQISKALTPFDFFYSQNIIKKSKVLFISASGKNTDIQFALKKALEFDAFSLSNLSMRLNNPLEILLKKLPNHSTSNYDLPTGKDGFLATNSLVAIFTLLYRSYNKEQISIDNLSSLNTNKYIDKYNDFAQEVQNKFNFTVLYGGWGLPVAYDIESKCTEAALGAVQLTDYRNFGHGRHHWFDKQKETSSIIAIVTPKEKEIAEKTLSLIPKEIPRLIINTDIENSLGSLDLLIKSFYLVSLLGDIRNIDPGKPGVPDFGKKLYHLKYSTLYKTSKIENSIKSIAIQRKSHVSSLSELTDIETKSWSNAFSAFVKKINSTDFTGIIFDYDGTLCPTNNRYVNTLEPEILRIFSELLLKGIKIGIVTGRGKSIRDLLRNSLPEKYWKLIVVGYYNGADTGHLFDDSLPNKISNPDESLIIVSDYLKDKEFILDINNYEMELRPLQLTLKTNNRRIFEQIKILCNQVLITKNITNVCVLESSHSMDLIIRPIVSKLNIIRDFFSQETVLCIGDKGLIPGNDFELLSTPYSLSVDEVSYNKQSCWNLAPKGTTNFDALLFYMNRITTTHSSSFKMIL